MDFPIFHLDFLNNRVLIAIIAILHVLINHALAVGFIPMVTFMEWLGFKTQNERWDKLAYKIMFVGFVITTTIGAMTGVGIWLSSSLINPYSIGSLIRVFFFAWFTEWIVFVTEVVLILIYFLTWKKSNASFRSKGKHILFGVALSIASWFTMAIIVGILGFMMDTGNWLTERSLVHGFTNPIYLPQLAFRTPLAMVMAGAMGLFLTIIFTKKGEEIRYKALRFLGGWMLLWMPVSLAASLWYYKVIPTLMIGNMAVAVGTQDFQDWYNLLTKFIFGALGVSFIIALASRWKPQQVPAYAYVVPVIVMLGFASIFERIREFIRKPYVIGNYMYSNGIRVDEYPLLQKEGVLKFATYVKHREVTEANKVEAGKDVFMVACSRCHTTSGINSIVSVFDRMYGGKGKPFPQEAMKNYIKNMHNARYYMPPFPGNEKELDALVAYIAQLQVYPESIEGAQTAGTPVQTTPEEIKQLSERILARKESERNNKQLAEKSNTEANLKQ
jgi:hypothetical protein